VFLPSLKQLSSAPQNREGESQYVMGTAQEDQLLAAVHLDQSTLKEEQHQQLEALLCEYADVLALDSSELGSTDVVTILSTWLIIHPSTSKPEECLSPCVTR